MEAPKDQLPTCRPRALLQVTAVLAANTAWTQALACNIRIYLNVGCGRALWVRLQELHFEVLQALVSLPFDAELH